VTVWFPPNSEAKELAEAVERLRRLEWEGWTTDAGGEIEFPACVDCTYSQDTGHASDCPLAAVLKRHPKQPTLEQERRHDGGW